MARAVQWSTRVTALRARIPLPADYTRRGVLKSSAVSTTPITLIVVLT